VFLDYQTRMQLQRLLAQLWSVSGKTVIFVTHDIEEAVTLADRVLIMSAHPGTVKQVVDIPLARPRDPLTVKESPGFYQLVRDISSAIESELGEQWPLPRVGGP